MKKIVSLVVLMSALTLSMQAQGVKFGLKGGLNNQDVTEQGCHQVR